jgi:hypothetical protein
MLSVIYAKCQFVNYAECCKQALNTECGYAECRYSECRGAAVKKCPCRCNLIVNMKQCCEKQHLLSCRKSTKLFAVIYIKIWSKF